jgi:LysR family hydrogen peroxide-inducible transcriptional activator
LRKADDSASNLHYEAGSIETLINLVDRNQGITIVPHLATLHLSSTQLKNIREFAKPKPVREISIVVQKGFPRKKILEFLRKEIVNGLPTYNSSPDRNVLDIVE